MQTLPREIYPVAAVREIDRCAIENQGIPGYELMTRAAMAAVDAATSRYPGAVRWLVACGAGNNAGDGYVLARIAAEKGVAASVVSLVDPASLGGDAQRAYADFEASGGQAMSWDGGLDIESDLIVDALLGSGLDRDVGGDFAAAVAEMNAHPAPTFALDIPTGLNGDTGQIMGTAVEADATITFVGLKSGLFLGNGPNLAGDLAFAGLDIPDECRDEGAAVFRRVGAEDVQAALGTRRRDAHKGDFGHVVVVGGGPGMPGAIRLCGEAALRTGAGLVSLATHSSHAAEIVAARPELMSHGVESAEDLQPLLDAADAVAFGPGLGQSQWAKTMYTAVLASTVPAVWDADALNMLAGRLPVDKCGEDGQRVITPHPGEAGRLLGASAADVQADRGHALEALAQVCGGTVVLKGAGSLVSTDDGAPWLCSAGNPGMASPGMGDVLTGIIAALLAQGLSPGEAARIGVAAHAAAGDRAATAGERGMIASDLLDELRAVINS